MLVVSCDIINPEEPIPAYITINSFLLETNYEEQGTNSEKINDVWINVDGTFLGVFELPAKFPVIAEGKHTITVRAGIKNNGIDASRIIYPFYKSYEKELEFIPGTVIELKPKIYYNEETIYKWLEDFETAGTTLVQTYKSDTSINQSVTNVFEGNASGLISLDKEHPMFEAKTIDSFYLPVTQKAIFLELNYKSNLVQSNNYNNLFSIGLFVTKTGQVIQNPVIYLNDTKNEWNKLYLDLTGTVSSYQDAKYFHVFVGAILDTSQYNGAEIYIDNIKLLHY
jgi:hypothetical protein